VEALEQGHRGGVLANKGCGGGGGLVLLAEADWLASILVKDGLRGKLLCIRPLLIPNSLWFKIHGNSVSRIFFKKIANNF
jgi:hypothetical protein